MRPKTESVRGRRHTGPTVSANVIFIVFITINITTSIISVALKSIPARLYPPRHLMCLSVIMMVSAATTTRSYDDKPGHFEPGKVT
ncbi:hypothetical protein RRG08_065457 [Elysia crispata]|uniref:Uncharacterized protein n=1 Tax=Elysia crispata TaxID=231223 RepID=A0AAE0YF21_9GAST|nr:hypothetical protein RRG08_065457 [Elysia crispata]